MGSQGQDNFFHDNMLVMGETNSEIERIFNSYYGEKSAISTVWSILMHIFKACKDEPNMWVILNFPRFQMQTNLNSFKLKKKIKKEKETMGKNF